MIRFCYFLRIFPVHGSASGHFLPTTSVVHFGKKCNPLLIFIVVLEALACKAAGYMYDFSKNVPYYIKRTIPTSEEREADGIENGKG